MCMDEHATDSVTSALGSSGNIPVSGSGLELNKSEHRIMRQHQRRCMRQPQSMSPETIRRADALVCGDWKTGDWKTALESLLYPNYSTMKQPYIKNSQTACSVGV